jgi:Bacterial Ig-like domain
MRSRVLFCLLLAACGDNKGSSAPTDGSNIDGKLIDAPPVDMGASDANPSDQIAAVKMTADSAGLALPIGYAIVTYLKPATGNLLNDPAGFTIQAQKTGPAIFVAVDPATTTPPLVRGDALNFTVTDLVTVGGQKRVTGISGLTRISQGFDVTTLSQDVSAATDLVSAIDNYDSELVDVTGSVTTFTANSGAGFEKSVFTTTGISGNTGFVLRVPATLRPLVDMVPTCNVTIKDTPVGRFNAETQIAAFTPADVTLSGCPAPTVISAVELTGTSVRVTFSRNVATGSVNANGSQFTFDNGLTATAATVSGRTVTLTTGAQAVGTTYTVTVAATVTDLQGSALATPNTATFLGFEQAASVQINEVNSNIAGGCDLIEFRVTATGTLRGIKVQERTGGSGELAEILPAVVVAKNDVVVLHLNGPSATCNPGLSANETTAITQSPAATFTKNYDTAWDLFSADTGLVVNDNVITVFDRFGTITDVVLIDDDVPMSMTANNVAAGSETAAAAGAAANQWQNVGGGTPTGGYVDDNFRLHAAVDTDAANTTTSTGDSIHRKDDIDNNDKSDWEQGAQTWGVINAGQATLP